MSGTGDRENVLSELIDAICEDRATPADMAALEAAILNDPEAQRRYVRQVHLHGLLKWELGQAADRDAVQRLKHWGASPSGTVEPATPPVSPARPSGATSSTGRWWAVAAAVLLTAAAGIYAGRRFGGDPGPPPGVATPTATPIVQLAQAIDARWAPGTAEPKPGGAMAPGKWNLAAGVARLDFADGATVTLEGPAEFTIVGERRGMLHRGRLTAGAPPEAIGFRIDTPSLAVVDLGTVFGVAADEQGASEVQVFDGEVVVALPAAAAEGGESVARRHLVEGDAARVEAGGRKIDSAAFNGSEFRRSWPVAWGVTQVTGAVKFVEPRPFLVPRTYEDDEHLVVIPERESIVIARDAVVAIREPGTYDGPFEPRRGVVPAGTRLRSYLVQFNPVGRNDDPVRAMTGSVTFDGPIAGLVCTTKELNAGDEIFGRGVDWRAGRGGGGVEAGDRVTISADRRTLDVALTAAAANDQIRVLVALPPLSANLPTASPDSRASSNQE